MGSDSFWCARQARLSRRVTSAMVLGRVSAAEAVRSRIQSYRHIPISLGNHYRRSCELGTVRLVGNRAGIFHFDEAQVLLTNLGAVRLAKNIEVPDPPPNEQLFLEGAYFIQQLRTNTQRRIECTLRPDKCSTVLSSIGEIGIAKVVTYIPLEHAKITCLDYIGSRSRARVFVMHDYAVRRCTCGDIRKKWLCPLHQVRAAIKDECALEGRPRLLIIFILSAHLSQLFVSDGDIGNGGQRDYSLKTHFKTFSAIASAPPFSDSAPA